MSPVDFLLVGMKLACWEEIIGRLKDVKDNGDGTVTLAFMVNHCLIEVTVPGGAEVYRQLVNRRVSLLRTDIQDKPYCVRAIDE